MFWGKGDSSKLSDEERLTLDDLRRLVETGHIIGLSPEQSAMAVRAINFFSRVDAAMELVVGFRNALVIAAALLGFWWFGNDALVNFIQTVGGKG